MVCFILPLLSLNTYFSYTCIFYPKMYMHHYTRGTFAPCPKDTLRSYKDLNKLHIWYSSSSEPRHNHTHSIYNIALLYRQSCTSCLYGKCNPKPALFQLANLPFLHRRSQLLVILFTCHFLLMITRRGFLFSYLYTCWHFGLQVFFLFLLFSQSSFLPRRSKRQQTHIVSVLIGPYSSELLLKCLFFSTSWLFLYLLSILQSSYLVESMPHKTWW